MDMVRALLDRCSALLAEESYSPAIISAAHTDIRVKDGLGQHVASVLGHVQQLVHRRHQHLQLLLHAQPVLVLAGRCCQPLIGGEDEMEEAEM